MLTINELQGRKVVLTGDALLNPIYLAEVACMLSAFGAQACVNKIDYIYLQALHGGHIPLDDYGVSGIDIDAEYQDYVLEQNARRLKTISHPKTIIASEMGSLSLSEALLENNLLELYRFSGDSYADGVHFLQSGSPDDVQPLKGPLSRFYGEDSLVGDVLEDTQEADQWDQLVSNLPIQYGNTKELRQFRISQIWTRVACVGRCARTREPLLAYDSFTVDWLSKTYLGKEPVTPITAACPLLRKVILRLANELTVEAFVSSLDSIIAQTLIRDSVLETAKTKENIRRAQCEDSLILALNLALGWIPVLGQAITLCSYLYQRARMNSDDQVGR